MRTGSTQSVPTASPKVTVVVAGDTHVTEGGGGNDRLVSVFTDEQAWGGQYVITLDNADETLNAKNYIGQLLDLTWGFVGESGSLLHPLIVQSQTFVSIEGKLALQLTCMDAWGLCSMVKAALGYAAWNQPWQTAGELAKLTMPDGSALPAWLVAEILLHKDCTPWDIAYALATMGTDVEVRYDVGENDDIIDTVFPPLTVTDAISGIRQVMEMTKCFLKCGRENTNDMIFTVINPPLHATAYAFTPDNTFFTNMQDSSFVAPNEIHMWAWNLAGSDWIENTTVRDTTSYALYPVSAHYMFGSLNADGRCDQATLTAIANGILSKVQGAASQGQIEAPMHCSLELFDKISITDSRYGTPKTSTGYVYRMIREYSRGIYKISIQIGGVTSGWTPPNGVPPIGIGEVDDPPITKTSVTGTPKGIQAYLTDVKITPTSQTAVSWNAGTVKFADGTTQSILAGTKSGLSTTPPIPVYYFYAVWGNTTLQNTTTYSDAIGIDRVLVGVAKASSITGIYAYAASPFGDNILINRDSVVDGIIGEAQLAAQAVTNAKIAIAAIQGDVIAASAITENKLATGAVTVDKIGANAVTAAKIAANTITANQIAANTITANQIAALTITGDKINASTISADKISAISLSLIQAQVATLSAITANCGTITSGSIDLASGTVVINSLGIKIVGQYLKFYDGTTLMGTLYGASTGLILEPASGQTLILKSTSYIEIISTHGLAPSSGYTSLDIGAPTLPFDVGYFNKICGYSSLILDAGSTSQNITMNCSTFSMYGATWGRLPQRQASAPSSANGYFYFDSGDDTPYVYANGAWRVWHR